MRKRKKIIIFFSIFALCLGFEVSLPFFFSPCLGLSEQYNNCSNWIEKKTLIRCLSFFQMYLNMNMNEWNTMGSEWKGKKLKWNKKMNQIEIQQFFTNIRVKWSLSSFNLSIHHSSFFWCFENSIFSFWSIEYLYSATHIIYDDQFFKWHARHNKQRSKL